MMQKTNNGGKDYRFDVRNKGEFVEDIRERSGVERRIIEKYCDLMGFEFEDKGVDNDGGFVEEANSVADYLIRMPDDDSFLVDVKFSNQKLSVFHFKISQVDSYKQQGAVILFVNGYETPDPLFVFINPEELEKFPQELFWEKECYRCYMDDFKWGMFR